MKYSEANLLVISDSEIGAIFHAPSGSILNMPKEDSDKIRGIQLKYQNGLMNEEEIKEFESFFDNLFAAKKAKRMAPLIPIDTNDTLGALKIMISTDCNLRCSYCYADGGSYGRERQLLSSKQVEDFIDALVVGRFTSVDAVGFFGGEPTLAPNTIEAACAKFKELVRHGVLTKVPAYSMTTNGL